MTKNMRRPADARRGLAVLGIGGLLSACAALLSACTAQPEPAPVAAPPPHVSFDGTYRGPITLTGVASGMKREWCVTEKVMTLQVADNSFTYVRPMPKLGLTGVKAPTFSATIGQDGGFKTPNQESGQMSGFAGANRISGTIEGIGCAYSFTLDRP